MYIQRPATFDIRNILPSSQITFVPALNDLLSSFGCVKLGETGRVNITSLVVYIYIYIYYIILFIEFPRLGIESIDSILVRIKPQLGSR